MVDFNGLQALNNKIRDELHDNVTVTDTLTVSGQSFFGLFDMNLGFGGFFTGNSNQPTNLSNTDNLNNNLENITIDDVKQKLKSKKNNKFNSKYFKDSTNLSIKEQLEKLKSDYNNSKNMNDVNNVDSIPLKTNYPDITDFTDLLNNLNIDFQNPDTITGYSCNEIECSCFSFIGLLVTFQSYFVPVTGSGLYMASPNNPVVAFISLSDNSDTFYTDFSTAIILTVSNTSDVDITIRTSLETTFVVHPNVLYNFLQSTPGIFILISSADE
jgi:hypothetical protein